MPETVVDLPTSVTRRTGLLMHAVVYDKGVLGEGDLIASSNDRGYKIATLHVQLIDRLNLQGKISKTEFLSNHFSQLSRWHFRPWSSIQCRVDIRPHNGDLNAITRSR